MTVAHDQLWQIWLAALITLGVYSYLYSDNKLYRILLNISIGLGVGYNFIIMWKQTVGPKWWDPMNAGFIALIKGQPGGASALWIIVGLLGVLWYFQLSRKYFWLSRIVIGMAVGSGAGVVFKASFLTNAPQITDSFRPLISGSPTALWSNGTPILSGIGEFSLMQTMNNILFVGTIVCVMVYFFFSFSHDRKAISSTAKTGRWLLMISFGAFFGNTVMTRMAVFLERLQYLIDEWIKYAMPHTSAIAWAIIGVAVLIIIVLYLLLRQRPPKTPMPEASSE